MCTALCAALAGCAPAANTQQPTQQPQTTQPDVTAKPDETTQPDTTTQSNATQQPAITEDEAKQIMLGRVSGATAADIVSLRLEWDDGRLIYDGELIFDGTEYDFEIDAQTGDILDMDTEPYPDRD